MVPPAPKYGTARRRIPPVGWSERPVGGDALYVVLPPCCNLLNDELCNGQGRRALLDVQVPVRIVLASVAPCQLEQLGGIFVRSKGCHEVVLGNALDP
jgi:hypothetical protein